MTEVGTSFTRWRAEALGLDYQKAFARLARMGFGLIRLSASWREVQQFGFRHLDSLLAEAAAARQPVAVTVGMKALGWPEFYLPEGMEPDDRAAQVAAIEHVKDVVRRFAQHRTVRAWQIENEPFNRSGPRAQAVPRALVRLEANAVRAIDSSRPLIVTTFAHFNESLDRSSSRHQSASKRRLGLAIPAEREALAILHQGDILGLDVYRAIGWIDATGEEDVAHAMADQLGSVRRWQRIARDQGKHLWVTEAQAEPWEARRRSHADPVTVAPEDAARLVEALAGAGVEMVMLWGSEYWLWREENGDPRWLESVSMGLRALA